jgi:hypothetical protein
VNGKGITPLRRRDFVQIELVLIGDALVINAVARLGSDRASSA